MIIFTYVAMLTFKLQTYIYVDYYLWTKNLEQFETQNLLCKTSK